MKVLVQRASRASVTVGGEVVGRIGLGLVGLVGVAQGDTEEDARYLVEKTVNLRIFPDEGDIDMVAAVRAWNEVGFDGVIRIDHCPGVVGDTPHADRSFAFQVGYLRGLVQMEEASACS